LALPQESDAKIGQGGYARFRAHGWYAYCVNHVVVVAASAGGLRAFIELISALPEDFPAPVIIVQHLPPFDFHQSQLREILSHFTSLRVKWIEDGEGLLGGTVYLSPQDVQSRVTQKLTFDISDNVRLLGTRPAADPLFSSLAEVFGRKVVAVVLTGALSDGARGAQCIADAGGRVLAQDEETALFFDMPQATIRRGVVDFVMPPIGIAHALIALTMAPGADSWFRVVRKPELSTDNKVSCS
jgi:two-component system, chemotaxis family, protein-glutamate methylesterase/glutaminase